jgi:hypothetical protein
MLKFEFCLPTTGEVVPDGADWFHEIKYDGYPFPSLFWSILPRHRLPALTAEQDRALATTPPMTCFRSPCCSLTG